MSVYGDPRHVGPRASAEAPGWGLGGASPLSLPFGERAMLNPTVTGVPGVRVGHYTDADAATGCTVALCPEGAVAGVDVRGSAPGTRETDLLRPVNLVSEAHAVLLSGGSAFGLDAASGVVRYLEERGAGIAFGGSCHPHRPGGHPLRPGPRTRRRPAGPGGGLRRRAWPPRAGPWPRGAWARERAPPWASSWARGAPSRAASAPTWWTWETAWSWAPWWPSTPWVASSTRTTAT